jgi:NADPH-dependent 2,4-dienoyl-CoA reductase/sulfur reductase-like enzyme
MRYTIVGNGVAGMEAAQLVRAGDAAGTITLVSHEHEHFFSRPALMYVFAGQLRVQDTEPYERDLYPRMGFERVRGRVVGLDPARRVLSLADGASCGYDKLLLAVGSTARPAPWPGSPGAGLHYFVTLGDLEALDHEARPGMRAVVVGGGLIGVEVAEILRERGLGVTFLVRERWYFPLALDRDESALVAEHMRSHGIDVRLGRTVQEIVRGPEGRVHAVELVTPRDGGRPEQIPADLVVTAIGVVPNTAFLAGSGVALAANGGVEVDEALRTTVPAIWAAGDCANVTWWDGSRRPEQLWYTAREQGRSAARSMLGEAAVYRRGTFYNSAKFFDLEYTTAGLVPASILPDGTPLEVPDAERWFRRVPGRKETQRIVVRAGRVIGFNMLGSRWDHEALVSWIEERRPLEWVLQHLDEARFDEELSRNPGTRPRCMERRG